MILLRHGQSLFNLHFIQTKRDPGIEDPELTPLGLQQARDAADALAAYPISHVIVSPYTRALQTAAPLIASRGVSVQVTDLVRERFAFSCDIGSSPKALAQRFPAHQFDHLPDPWWPGGFEPAEATIARAGQFRRLMAERPDHENILLVSHWAFILALTGTSVMNGEYISYDPTTKAPEQIIWSH